MRDGDSVSVLGVLQARTSSSRLPGKVMLPILGVPMLVRQIERLRRSQKMGHLVVATSVDASDDALAALCTDIGVEVSRGSLDDVLDRFVQAARPHDPKWVIRLTGDCPVADHKIIDSMISASIDGDYDYVTNCLEPTYPDGLDAEVVRCSVLETAWRNATMQSEREHVTPFIYKHPERFRICQLRARQDYSKLRWTVDELRDFELVTRIYEALYPTNPDFDFQDILALLKKQPELATFNTVHERNEGYAKSLSRDG